MSRGIPLLTLLLLAACEPPGPPPYGFDQETVQHFVFQSEERTEIPDEASALLDQIREPGRLADVASANLDGSIHGRMKLLEMVDVMGESSLQSHWVDARIIDELRQVVLGS